jgi:[acyl-carrier-protein] S-malonyltransferase
MKAIPLAVAGAFHTVMMKPAADSLAQALNQTKLTDPANIKVIANINAEYYKTASEISQGLQKQLIAPILWQKCMEKLIADGVEQFYEIGPGKVLTGLMKRINRKAKVTNVSDLASLQILLSS